MTAADVTNIMRTPTDAEMGPLEQLIADTLDDMYDGLAAVDDETGDATGVPFVEIARNAVDDVQFVGVLTSDGRVDYLYAVEAQIAPPLERDASSSPPEELSAGGTTRPPEAGDNVWGDTETESGAAPTMVAPDSPPDTVTAAFEELERRAQLIEEILTFPLQQPSKLWRGFRASQLRGQRVERFTDMTTEALEQVLRAAAYFARQMPPAVPLAAEKPDKSSRR